MGRFFVYVMNMVHLIIIKMVFTNGVMFFRVERGVKNEVWCLWSNKLNSKDTKKWYNLRIVENILETDEDMIKHTYLCVDREGVIDKSYHIPTGNRIRLMVCHNTTTGQFTMLLKDEVFISMNGSVIKDYEFVAPSFWKNRICWHRSRDKYFLVYQNKSNVDEFRVYIGNDTRLDLVEVDDVLRSTKKAFHFIVDGGRLVIGDDNVVVWNGIPLESVLDMTSTEHEGYITCK
jgi:hypothetical protein